MNIKFIKMSMILTLLLIVPLAGLTEEINKMVKEAKKITEDSYFTFQKGDFLKASGICERVLSQDKNNPHALYYLGYSQYRLLNIAMVANNKKELEELLDKAVKNANNLAEYENYKSEANVLLAGIHMMELTLNPNEAMTLSQVIHGYLDKALAEDENNPRAYLIRGTMIFNTPEAFGGGAKNAVNLLQNSINLFEKEKDKNLMPSWGKLEAMAWLGRAYQANKEYGKAKEIFQKTLEEEPNFSWVKYNLLPSLESAINQK